MWHGSCCMDEALLRQITAKLALSHSDLASLEVYLVGTSVVGTSTAGVMTDKPVPRRDFFRVTGARMVGTAVGALASLGADLGPKVAHASEMRIKDAVAVPSICPYCAVGCSTLVHVVDNRIVNIEGNPAGITNFGTLCPKGAAIYQLHVNPNRLTKVLHRAPGATEWEVWDLHRAMDRVAELIKQTRDETFIERLPDGTLVNHTRAIFSLGGATLANEWNHIQQKLMRGLGVIAIENQARI
jgi:formate dehydrogenase major subunit